MDQLIIRLLSLIIYIIILHFFFSAWSLHTELLKKHFFIILLLIVLLIFSNSIFSTLWLPFINLLFSISLIILVGKNYHVTGKELYFWVFFLLAISLICENLSFEIFKRTTLSHYSTALFILVTASFTSIIEILIVFTLRVFILKKHSFYSMLNKPILISLLTIPIASIIILVVFLLPNLFINLTLDTSLLFAIVGILYINLAILYLYNSLTNYIKKTNYLILEKKALDFELKYIEEIKRSQDEIKYIKHDLKNQFLVLTGLLQQNQIEAAQVYLENSLQTITQSTLFYTNDPVLNYLLNEKYKIANKEKIDFKINVLLAEKTQLENEILTIIIGNILDNALSATTRLPNNYLKKINLTIKQFQHELLIEVINTFNPLEKETRKKRALDGIGIKSIQTLVEKNGGIYKQWSENNLYVVSIVLFNFNEQHPNSIN